MEEIKARGYGNSNKLVCHECTADYALKNYIKQNGQRGVCDYCGKDRKCIQLEDLMSPIMEGIFSEYDDAAECLGWDSSEGGYLGTTYSTDELIHDELYDELGIDNDKLLNDIACLINDNYIWCDRDPYSEREDEGDYYSWSAFSKLVKEKSRYVFYKISEKRYGSSFSSPAEILDTIGSYVELLNLIIILNPKNRRIYRGRTHQKQNAFSSVADLSLPPPEKAKANRMSPEGISMFYGAFDKETALSEIYCTTDEYATIAEFCLLRSLKVLDLTKPTWLKMPSLFDPVRRNRRAPLLFFRRFAQDICKKAIMENSIEYVPTQIVTEYFKHVFRTSTGESLDGIVYRSAQKENGKCIVLFVEQTDCVEEGANKKGILSMNPLKLSQYRKAYLPIK